MISYFVFKENEFRDISDLCLTKSSKHDTRTD